MNKDMIKNEMKAFMDELIKTPSYYPPGDTDELCEVIAKNLKKWGYETEIVSNKEKLHNVVATMGSGSPVLGFNVHIDTVGVEDESVWKTPPFEATEKDGKIYGLGAGNCKGTAAVHLWLAKALAEQGGPEKGTVIFSFVGDEESLGDDGTALLRKQKKLAPDMLIVGAQTENSVVVRERGVMWAKLTSFGKAAHAGDAFSGDNAIFRMARLLAKLESSLLDKIKSRNDDGLQSCICVGQIKGGTNTNIVPSSCSAYLDRRLLPTEDVDAAYKEIEETLDCAGEPEESFELTRIMGTNGFSAPKDGNLVTSLSKSILETTGTEGKLVDAVGVFDGRFYANDGIEIVDFGPGAGKDGHIPNEFCPIDEMVESGIIQLKAISKILS